MLANMNIFEAFLIGCIFWGIVFCILIAPNKK